MKLNKYIQKTCCFYASDWHLTVMLLPYMNKKIEENSSIYMKCENDIEEKMEILLNKLNIKNKIDILNINWNNKVADDDENEKEKIYIVSGRIQYINEMNETIEKFYKYRKDNVKIINCYAIEKGANLNKIIKENGYTQILNTRGEKSLY